MPNETRVTKPLGAKSYGSIPHLRGSRLGPGDHHVHWGIERILTEKKRDKRDTIIVTEKVDGSCVAVANVDGKIVALGRAGWPAQSSKYEQHQLFAAWVRSKYEEFAAFIPAGYRLCGEWVAQAHGTRYAFTDPPFFAFDLMTGTERSTDSEMWKVSSACNVKRVPILHQGGPISIDMALGLLGQSGHVGATDPAEGLVYRCEREGRADFLAKYVRPGLTPGKYLRDITGHDEVWLWRPSDRHENTESPCEP